MPVSLISESTVFASASSYFFDANIWCYIHSPQQAAKHPHESSQYAKVWAKIKEAGGCVVVSPLLISEYINSRLRVYWREWQANNSSSLDFKSFRKKQPKIYNKSLSTVLKEVADILQDSAIVGDISDINRTNAVMNGMISNSTDVNDSYFIELCAQNGFILITHDKDFKNAKPQVLTYNSNM